MINFFISNDILKIIWMTRNTMQLPKEEALSILPNRSQRRIKSVKIIIP